MKIKMNDTHPRNTELVTWSDNLSVGIDMLDSQHKTLIDLANEPPRGKPRGILSVAVVPRRFVR